MQHQLVLARFVGEVLRHEHAVGGQTAHGAQLAFEHARGVFRRVLLPLSLPGVLSGITMVFVPAVSTFVISRIMGGSKYMLLGDLIEMQFLGAAYNPYLGSAIALVMMVIVMICMLLMNKFGSGDEQVVAL